MKTFKTIEDCKKYMKDFEDTLYLNKDFMKKNNITMVFSFSINKEVPENQIILGNSINVGADICMLFKHLPKDLVKAIYETFKEVK